MAQSSICRALFVLCLAIMVLLSPGVASAQSSSPEAIPALFLSDIHFDPFHDPARAKQLAEAPVEQWAAILGSAPSPDQPQAFATIQRACNARGIDTPYTLLRSSLNAIHAQASGSRFVTISGDLLAHGFDCRYERLVRSGDPAGYAAFVDKTIRFLMLELKASLPGVPIYMGMGNNDSACGDYRMDRDGSFLASTAKTIALGLPPSPDREQALHDFTATGEYAISLPAPMRDTRLLVLDDIFLSNKYANCAGHPDSAAVDAQLAWLQHQLAEARRLHQRVWVMGHIPPGIDLYATMIRGKGFCTGTRAISFLADERLARLLLDYSAEIRLSLFGHTHQDEMRLFRPENNPAESLPIKMVASITPVNGNMPSFTLASVDPVAAKLADYRVIVASNPTGIDTTWSEEYDFRRAYHQPDFDAASLTHLTKAFQADADAATPESRAYIADYLPGDSSSLIKPVWPQYVCMMTHNTAEGFAACACPTAPQQ